MALSFSCTVITTSLPRLSRPFYLKHKHTTTPRYLRTLITCSPNNFNLTFAPPKPKPISEPEPEPEPNQDFAQQLYIPWIVRDENGNLTLQSTPPARLLHAISDAKTGSPVSKNKKKKNKKERLGQVALTSEPKHSKAARRFYNENFRDPPQRLSKVLAAAGGTSALHSFLYTSIFQCNRYSAFLYHY